MDRKHPHSQYSHTHGVTIHRGPMSGTTDTHWEDDARKLEELNQRRIESPMKTPPNNLTTIDKSLTHLDGADGLPPKRSKGDTGMIDTEADGYAGGDHFKA